MWLNGDANCKVISRVITEIFVNTSDLAYNIRNSYRGQIFILKLMFVECNTVYIGRFLPTWYETSGFTILVADGHITLLKLQNQKPYVYKEFSSVLNIFVVMYPLRTWDRQTDRQTHRSCPFTLHDKTSSLSKWNLLFPVVIFTLCKW
jgi:hypothetical protein